MHPKEFISNLGGGDGSAFVTFMRDLLIVAVGSHGIRQCDLTITESAIRDGSIDIKLDQGFVETGNDFFEYPTVLQAKAGKLESNWKSKIDEELKNDFARDQIQQNYRYLYAVCDWPGTKKATEIDEHLAKRIAEINGKAPKPLLIHLERLRRFARNYPPIVFKHFHRTLENAILIDTWKTNVRAQVPTYVRLESRAQIDDALADYVDFSKAPRDSVFRIQGGAGVGKTRGVFEDLNLNSQIRDLVLYCDSGRRAWDLVTQLIRDEGARAIIVADECRIAEYEKLTRIVTGSENRIRVIAIDNQGIKEASLGTEYHLEKISEDDLEKILEANFNYVNFETRHRVSQLCGGYIALAADMCKSTISPNFDGNLHQPVVLVKDYLKERFESRPDDLKILSAVSLFQSIGYADEVRQQHEQLTSCISDLPDAATFRDIAKGLKNSPGFVNRSSTRFYTTPEIVATAAFQIGWEKWVEGREKEFIETLPEDLARLFFERVERSASPEIREKVSVFFSKWLNELTPDDLTDSNIINRLEKVVELQPSRFLPVLSTLLVNAADTGLLGQRIQIEGDRFCPPAVSQPGKIIERRRLVWLLERLAAFPEYFNSCEDTLFLLALHETERGLSNNASAVWRHLMQPELSGTAVSFNERLRIVRRRIESEDPAESWLGSTAIESAFNDEYYGTIAGRPVVAGRLAPPSWTATCIEERDSIITGARELLFQICNSPIQFVKNYGKSFVIEHTPSLIRMGFLDIITDVFPPNEVDEDTRPKLLNSLTEVISLSDSDSQHWNFASSYKNKITKYKADIKPGTTQGKIRSLVATRELWPEEKRNNVLQQLDSLACELMENKTVILGELQWLSSEKANLNHQFGKSLGKYDRKGELLGPIFDAAKKTKCGQFAGGYVSGLLSTNGSFAEQINRALDDLEKLEPELSTNISGWAPGLRLLDRTVGLVNQGRLPSDYLKRLAYETKLIDYDDKQVVVKVLEAFKRRIDAHEKGSFGRACETVIQFRNRFSMETMMDWFSTDKQLNEIIWAIAEAANDDAYIDWREMLEILCQLDRRRSISLAFETLPSDALGNNAVAFILSQAKLEPKLCLEKFGGALLDHPVIVFKSRIADLLQVVPVNESVRWLEQGGIERIRSCARFLGYPYVDQVGEVITPDLLSAIMEKYGEDRILQTEYALGPTGIRSWSGDIVSQHEEEAEKAKKLLQHPIYAVRRWAKDEFESAKARAASMRKMMSEELVP